MLPLIIVTLSLAMMSPGTDAAARFNYKQALSESTLFYMAQRSGKLPDRLVPWRGDSALNDGSDVGRDLTGGWYDAGDFVKFNFPQAGATTLLLWGLVQFQDGYTSSGLLGRMRDLVKWPLDYFLKCWDEGNKIFYGQVGKEDSDHSYWGRPEDLKMARPAYRLTTAKPGSDLAAETAAAFAAGYLAFKNIDAAYADRLLNAAKSLYSFANTYRGLYSNSITDAKDAYPSSSYQDELCWGAAWLYKATKDPSYKQLATRALSAAGTDSNEFSWDDKGIGCVVLLHELETQSSAKSQYAGYINNFLGQWRQGRGGIKLTHCGLSFFSKWGSLRYALNAALIGLMAAEAGIDATGNRRWAISQLNYALGDNKYGRSYEVGFGVNPPQEPHHASSSCPSPPAKCDWANFDAPGPNPHVLYGALVGGPDDNDSYADKRTDYVMNEVTCDYNSGFHSVLAGALSLESRGSLPSVTPACPQPNHPAVIEDQTTKSAAGHTTASHVRTTSEPGRTQAPGGSNLDCTQFGQNRHRSTGSAYYPDSSQGGVMDMNDHKLQTLQDYLDGKVTYVSVSMDDRAGIAYGTALCIPELNHKYGKVILFKVVDYSSDQRNKGYSLITICVKDKAATQDATLTGPLTLVFH